MWRGMKGGGKEMKVNDDMEGRRREGDASERGSMWTRMEGMIWKRKEGRIFKKRRKGSSRTGGGLLTGRPAGSFPPS